MSKEDRTIEETYQKMEPVEHILRRPDTYIGSTDSSEQELWLLSADEKSFEQRTIQLVPGLYKIFDEILVNAADNYQRDQSMDTLKVNIDEESGKISVWNNGQ